MHNCESCGVGSTGAFLVEVDGELLYEDCRGPGTCERCGTETEEATLSGSFKCRRRQEHRRGESTSREVDQERLGSFG